jgi:ATP/ADP translocase
LLVLTALHFCVGAILWTLHRDQPDRPARADEALPSRRDVFRRAPFLWNLAVLVLAGTTSAAMLDYLFKSGAVEQFGGRSPALLRYFALFYTGAQILTFLVQTMVSRLALEKLGLSRTVGALPFAVGAGSAIALVVPMFSAIASVRAIELILRGSLFRAGYEIFYTPIAPRDKRAVKVLIDVGCDRMGDRSCD